KIVEKKADYVLNVKANQPVTLLELEEHFKSAIMRSIGMYRSTISRQMPLSYISIPPDGS
ncbi:MAG: hypothetical protein Q4E10_03350, partial [Porphyromonas sp.]|nr:hypothetical protein [Porphyromonas sp.]